MKKNSVNYIIVAGCSRLGATLASTLSSQGKEVVVIDHNGEAFRNLHLGYSGFSINGDPTDIDMLIKAGIEKADLVIAATNDDNSNILVSQIARKIFNVPKVISRIYDTEKEIIYQGLDIRLIHPTKLSVDEFNKLLDLKETGV